MNNYYIKNFPRGDAKRVAAMEHLLPICTDHLSTLYNSIFVLEKIKKIAGNAGNDIVDRINDVEKQGKFNAFLNLCFLDFIVIYKYALTATHYWEDTHSLRQGYLLIHAAIDRYYDHSKSLKELSAKSGGSVTKDFADLTDAIKKFRKDYQYDSDIYDIRNNTIAHIENDPVRFYERISMFDNEQAFKALEAFVSILVKMLKLSDEIFLQYTRSTIAHASFQLAAMNQYSAEIESLLNAFESQSFVGIK